MGTTAAPYGAVPWHNTDGNYSVATRERKIASGYATKICYNDFVKNVNDGSIAKDTGTTTLTSCGIFRGCKYTDSTGSPVYSQHWPASTVASDAVAFVCEDPHLVFIMQADGSLDVTAVGANAGVTQTAGSASLSGNALTASTVATTGTLPIRILGIKPGPGNAAGDAYTEAICAFNAGHQLLNTTGV